MAKSFLISCLLLPITMLVTSLLQAQDTLYLLQPDRVFDGEQLHEGWQVLVKNGFIESAGTQLKAPTNARIIKLKGCTLLPGLIEGHSHLFLHPYNEVS